MYCPKCGMKNEDDSLFCVKCGGRLSETDVNAGADEGRSEEFEDTIIMKPVKSTGEFAPKPERKDDYKEHRSTKNVRSTPKATRIADEESAVGGSSKASKVTIIVLSCCLAVLLAVFGIFAFRLSASQNKLKSDLDKVQQSETEKKDTKDTKTKTEKKTDEKENTDSNDENDATPNDENRNFSTIPVDMAYSSSERSDGGYTFNSSYAVDSKLSTAWSPATSGGVGECITLCFSTERTVHGLKISNGYSKSDEDYLSNARLKGFTVKFPNGSTFASALADNTTALQDIRFSSAVDCQSITIYVDSIYSASEDGSAPLCISEIEVY